MLTTRTDNDGRGGNKRGRDSGFETDSSLTLITLTWLGQFDRNMPITLTLVTLNCRMISSGLECLIQPSYATQNFIYLLEDFGVGIHIDGFTCNDTFLTFIRCNLAHT